MLLQIHSSIDWTAILTTAIPTVISLGLTMWVYKVLNAIIIDLKEQVKTLKEDVAKLKESENKWFRKYHILAGFISRKRCANEDCQIHQAYVDYVSKEGEAI